MSDYLPPYPVTISVYYVASFLLALIFGWILTPCIRELARKCGVMDKPDPRRVNKVPVPRGGGLAIFLAFHLTVFVLRTFTESGADGVYDKFYSTFFIGSTVLAVVGVLDDVFSLKPLLKLLGQIGVALYFCSNGLLVELPFEWAHVPVIQWGVTVVWIVGIVNAFNLIDGLDGLASGLALIACIGMIGTMFFAQLYAELVPYLVFAGAVLAFLRFNFNPASVFLGDTGSMFIGLAMATLPLVSKNQGTLLVSMGVPVLCVGVPIIDTALAIFRRSVRAIMTIVSKTGESPHQIMTADKDHIHHRILLAKGGHQRRAVYVLYTFAIGLVATAFFCVVLQEKASGVFLVAFLPFSLIIVRYMTNIELWDTGCLLSESRRTPFRRSIAIPIYLAADLTFFAVCWLIACFITGLNPLDPLMLKLLPTFCVPLFLTLFLSKHYSRSWSQARQCDELIIVVAVGIGFIASHTIVMLYNPVLANAYRPFHLCFSLIVMIPLLCSRIFRAAVLQATSLIENHRLMAHAAPGVERTLVYGAGYHMHSYMNEFVYNLGGNRQCIIGVIDDNPNLRGTYACDLRVFGNLDEFEAVFDRYRPTRVVVASELLDDRKEALFEFAARHNLKIFRWSCQECRVSLPDAKGESDEVVL